MQGSCGAVRVSTLYILCASWQVSGGSAGCELRECESARLEPDGRTWERVADIFQKLQLDNGPINLFILFQSATVLHLFTRLFCDRINFFLFFPSSLISCTPSEQKGSRLDPSHPDDSYTGTKQPDFRRPVWFSSRTSSPFVWPYLFWRLCEGPAPGLERRRWRAIIQGEGPQREKTWTWGLSERRWRGWYTSGLVGVGSGLEHVPLTQRLNKIFLKCSLQQLFSEN